MAARLSHITVNATTKHSATVVFLHGLGDSGEGWRPAVDLIKHTLPHVKWVLPNAPNRSITANFGMMMPGWFDIRSFDWKAAEDEAGLLASALTIGAHIQAEIDAGTPARRIVLGGFSQGGAMALLAGLTDAGGIPGGLGGVAALSGWLPLRDTFSHRTLEGWTTTPVFVGHGTADPLVPYRFAEKTAEVLTGLGMGRVADLGAEGVCFKSYEGVQHTASKQTLDDLAAFLKRVLPDE